MIKVYVGQISNDLMAISSIASGMSGRTACKPMGGVVVRAVLDPQTDPGGLMADILLDATTNAAGIAEHPIHPSMAATLFDATFHFQVLPTAVVPVPGKPAGQRVVSSTALYRSDSMRVADVPASGESDIDIESESYIDTDIDIYLAPNLDGLLAQLADQEDTLDLPPIEAPVIREKDINQAINYRMGFIKDAMGGDIEVAFNIGQSDLNFDLAWQKTKKNGKEKDRYRATVTFDPQQYKGSKPNRYMISGITNDSVKISGGNIALKLFCPAKKIAEIADGIIGSMLNEQVNTVREELFGKMPEEGIAGLVGGVMRDSASYTIVDLKYDREQTGTQTVEPGPKGPLIDPKTGKPIKVKVPVYSPIIRPVVAYGLLKKFFA